MSVDVMLMFAFFLGPFVMHSVHIKTGLVPPRSQENASSCEGPPSPFTSGLRKSSRHTRFKNRGTIPTQGPVTEFMPRLGRPDKASQLHGYRQHVRVVPAEAIK